MKKYFLFPLLIAAVPNVVFGASARYTQLVREKQNKMAQLEKCMGSNKGLKIAGISTLGLTAVGVAGNIAEASAIKKYDSQIASTDKKIEKVQAEIAEKQATKKDEPVKASLTQESTSRVVRTVALADIAAINAGGSIGSRAVAHGYEPEQLSQGLASQFATAMLGFIDRCYQNKGKNGIETVSAGSRTETDWRALAGIQTYADDAVLPDLNEHEIAYCKIETCKEATHTKRGNECVEKSSDCTDEAKAKDSHVVSAIKNGAKCEIQQCEDGFNPSQDKSKCEEIKKEDKKLSQREKIDCHSRIMRDFMFSVPAGYQSKYNEYLSELQNRTADKDGVIDFEYSLNGVSYTSVCKSGQKWSACTNSATVLPAIAKFYIKQYAENQECGDSNNVSIESISIIAQQTEQDCPKGTVWSPSMQRCQDPETAANNAEFDRRLKECEKGGAQGYSVDRGCLCPNEQTQEWNGTRCVPIDVDARAKCRRSGGNWENAKCNCFGGDDNYDSETQTCKGFEELRSSVSGLTVAPISAPEIKPINVPASVTVSISQAELGCERTDGYWDDGKCDCPPEKPYWDSVENACKNPVFANQNIMSDILAQPTQEESVPALPDRSATSYFVH